MRISLSITCELCQDGWSKLISSEKAEFEAQLMVTAAVKAGWKEDMDGDFICGPCCASYQAWKEERGRKR